jgi:hypothetical protein
VVAVALLLLLLLEAQEVVEEEVVEEEEMEEEGCMAALHQAQLTEGGGARLVPWEPQEAARIQTAAAA